MGGLDIFEPLYKRIQVTLDMHSISDTLFRMMSILVIHFVPAAFKQE